MTRTPTTSLDRRWAAAGGVLFALLAALLVGLVAVAARADPAPVSAYRYPLAREAPPLDLIDQGGRPFDLASLRGAPVLLFFGYTHCPDVCPQTFGVLNQVIADAPDPVHAVFVTVDPDRDTTDWLSEYLSFLPAGYTGLTGTPDQIRATADAYGVRYARVESDDPAAYSMAHTADVYLIDDGGRLRARFPFGTAPGAILDEVAAVERDADPVTAATASRGPVAPSVAPEEAQPLQVVTVSTAVWAGEASPLVVRLHDQDGRTLEGVEAVTVTLRDGSGAPVSTGAGQPVRSPTAGTTMHVVDVTAPSAGTWTVEVEATGNGSAWRGTTTVSALVPGGTPAVGGPAPAVRTRTVADAGGAAVLVTTDPTPDLRLSSTSTEDALRAHQPFVLVVDSWQFRVSPACGRAIALASDVADRWPDVAFIHLEPYRYHVDGVTPVLDGPFEDPPLVDEARAWGLGAEPWPAEAVPWMFVVDGNGLVRGKFEGVMGTDEVEGLLGIVDAGGPAGP